MTNHLQRIKCRRADIPNPEIPVRIHLALEKVPDLIKGIFTLLNFYSNMLYVFDNYSLNLFKCFNSGILCM